MKFGILNEKNGMEISYIKACEDLNIDYEVIDFVSNQWWENVIKSDCNGFLIRASGDNEVNKNLFNERLFYVNKYLKKPLYPSYESILLYENKRMQAYWLAVNKFPHPKTWVFYSKKEAREFVDKYENYPLLFKPNLGGKAEGVKFVENKFQAKKLIDRLFTKFGFFNRGLARWKKYKRFFKVPVMDDKQYNYVILQQYIDVKFEWRIIKVGDSYFGHQKAKVGRIHSGNPGAGHVDPPKQLLELTKKVCDVGNFRAMNVDIFEDKKGNYFINELQTFWGGKKKSQMTINGKYCRYKDIDGNWILEHGTFNQNRSCNLRVEDFVKILKKNDKK